MPSAPAFCAYEFWKLRRPTLNTATPSVRKTPKSIKVLRIDLVLVQELLELIGVEIGQDFVACHKSGHVGLSGKLLHKLVCLSISSNVDFLKPVAFLGQIILRINAPRAPLATVKLQFHRQRGIKRVATTQSTGKARLIWPGLQ